MKAADLFPWRHEVRAGTIGAVRRLSPEHLAWKPAGGRHAIMDWLRHIAQHEDWWLQVGLLGRREFVPRKHHQLLELEQVLGYLAESRAATERFLADLPLERLHDPILAPPARTGAQRPTLTILGALGQIFNHELHHRGQIFLHLRLMSIDPPVC